MKMRDYKPSTKLQMACQYLRVVKERIKEIFNEKQRHLKLESEMKYQFRTSD